MKKPCPNCPFRTDVRPFLHPARAKEIATAEHFVCHKTTAYDEHLDDTVVVITSQTCAGWEMLNRLQPNDGSVYLNAARMGTAYRKEWKR